MSSYIADYRIPESKGWTKDAECAKPGAPDMFPHETYRADIQAAKDTCNACPVRPMCLDEAMARYEPHGIWGGLTTDERRYQRRTELRQERAAKK